MKRCSMCQENKSATAFSKDASRRDGKKHQCKKCCAALSGRWKALNREHCLARMAAYRAANRTKMSALSRAWAKRNKDLVASYAVDWREKNRAHHNAYKAKRRAEKTQATPPWACAETMASFYAEASYLGREIDHIVPLKSPLVCGLHWEGNMQALTETENNSKGNRRWPDMP